VFPDGVTKGPSNLGQSGGIEGGVVGGVVGGVADIMGKPTIRRLEQVPEHLSHSWRRGLPALQDCYETRLQKQRDLKGDWRVTFLVTREGLVSNLEIVSLGAGDAPLEQCLGNEIEKREYYNLPRDESFGATLSFHH
jgi:hypothetical protein